MAIVDLDDLLEKKEKTSFKLFGKEYVLPELSYALALKLEDLRKKAESAVKKEDAEQVMNTSIEVISAVVPELDSDILRRDAALLQVRSIANLINDSLLEEDEDDKELAYYRKTYGDEYRKKGKGSERKDLK